MVDGRVSCVGEHMKMEHLKEFVVFARHLNFTAAAKALAMTQPGLSNHIAQLEKELGAVLVHRDAPVRLTPAGFALLKGAQSVLAEYEKTEAAVHEAARAAEPVHIHDRSDVPGLADALASIGPMSVELVQLDFSSPVLDDLRNGVIDVTFIHRTLNDAEFADRLLACGLAAVPVAMGEVVICVEKSSLLAQKKTLSREDLRGADVVINAIAWFDVWKTVLGYLLGDDLDITYRLDPVRSRPNLRFVRLGNAVHICTKTAIDDMFENRDDIVVFDELDGNKLLYELNAVYRADDLRAEAVVGAIKSKALSDFDGSSRLSTPLRHGPAVMSE